MAIVSPLTRAQTLATRIEASIAERGLSRGDSLGTIDIWREQSGFARATVSEAVRILIDRGLVEIRPGRGGGVFVAETGPVVRLRHTLLSVHGEASTVADAIVIREALEALVVEDATRQRSSADAKRLTRLLAALHSASGDRDDFIRANWELHEMIASITANSMLKAIYLTMMHVIRDRSERAMSDSDGDPGEYVQHRLAVHDELVNAIVDGDAERARHAVASHAK